MDDTPAWVEQALSLPLGFAQVREDPRGDLTALRRAGGAGRVVMVGSGGDTAALLAASGLVSRLCVADPNPAQRLLTRLKLDLLAEPPTRRLALLGHAPLPPAERARWLASELGRLGADPDALGPADLLARDGPDHAGRYERTFAQLRRLLAPHAGELDDLLALADPARQAPLVAPGTRLGAALDAAFAATFSHAVLVRLFGPDATRRPARPFAEHFAERTRWVLAHQPAARNPWLHQMLRGRFAPEARYDWLDASPPAPLPPTRFVAGPVQAALADGPPGAADYVHLSNVLDWLPPEEAARTLAAAHRALRPGGVVLVRQLNSSLDVRLLASGLSWDAAASAALHRADRSFFYSALHLGRRP